MTEAPVEEFEWVEIHTESESFADHRLALFVGKYITPLLMAIVTGLFLWVWQTSTEVIQLREHLRDINKDIDKLRSGIINRPKQPQTNDILFEPGSDWPISGSDP